MDKQGSNIFDPEEEGKDMGRDDTVVKRIFKFQI